MTEIGQTWPIGSRMYKASRTFISERSRHSRFLVQLVQVRRHPIHQAQACLENAYLASRMDILGFGSKQNLVVAGWIAHKYHPVNRVSEFAQHWWNFHPVAREYFDTTPMDEEI